MLRLLYDWLVAPPANWLAYLALAPAIFAPAAGPIAAWFFLVHYIDGASNGRPTRFWTGVLATIVSGYVLLLTIFALMRLPHVAYELLVRSGGD